MKIMITGASVGIGRALALYYANRGDEVVLLSRNTDILRELSSTINKSGGRSSFMQCDVTRPEDVDKAVRFSVETMGSIDLAILNAGVSNPIKFNDFNMEDFRTIYEINVFGVVNGLKALVPVMRAQGGGTIAGISSIADVRGFEYSGAYCSSKSAATKILESARTELGPLGIDIVTIRPGFIKTAMTAKNKFYMPLMMEVDKAAMIISKGLDKRKKLIAFPRRMVFLTWLARAVPDTIFEAFVGYFSRKVFKKGVVS